jgi:3-oxoacyl-[acyl-carrier-protein] synthase II
MSSRRTVVTGIGLITPLGLGTDATWAALCAGKSGVRRIQSFDARNLPVQIAGEVAGFEAKAYIAKESRKQIKVMARGIQLAVGAAQIAFDDSRLDKAKLDPTRLGIEFGSGLLPTELNDLAQASHISALPPNYQVDMEKWGAEGLAQVEPLWLLKYLPNFLASHISILHNAQGPNNSIIESDVSSLLALGEARRVLVRNQADVMIVGGAESRVHPLTVSRLSLFSRLSTRNDAPEKAARPFEKKRDGAVLAEGAAVLLVEDLEAAKKRGARIYGEVCGFGCGYDKKHDGAGLARVIQAALTQADVRADDIDHVSAHGLSDPELDHWEAQGIAKAFQGRPVPVFAAQSYFGNVGAGAGTLDVALSLLALGQGTLPATLNYDEPDTACPVAVNCVPRAIARPWFVKVSLNAMGHCAAVVCRRWEGD